MKKAVVHWSGTGNTEAMAKAVAEAAGAKQPREVTGGLMALGRGPSVDTVCSGAEV